MLDIVVCYFLAAFLEFLYKFLDAIDEDSLDFASEHFTTAVLLANLLQPGVVFEEESQILVWNIHVKVSTLRSLIF